MTREEAIKELRGFIGQMTEGCQEAMEVLIPELAESEDEKIRKGLIDIFNTALGQDFLQRKAGLNEKEVIAYLEKQKEPQNKSMAHEDCSWPGILTSPLCKDKNLDDIAQEYVEGVKEYNPTPDWNLIHTAVCYGYHLAEQKEQIPITESKRLANEVIEYLARCGYSPVLKDDSKKEHFHIDIPRHEDDFWHSEEYKHCRSVLGEYYMEGDYGGDTYTLYIWRTKKEQKPAEWSEEDEKMVKEALYCVGYTFGSTHPLVDWLKSLRPSWKPSEEQIKALEYVIRDYREDSCNATANYLQEILDHLKNM